MLPELWNDLRYRLRALFQRNALDRELDDELRFHLEREAAKYERLGMTPASALRRARLAFGGVDRAKEESRDARGTALFESLVQDLRYAVRGLRAKPAFTIGVVLTLGLGIGANAAMFGIIDQLLLRAPAHLLRPEQVDRVYLSRMRDRVTRIDDGFSFPRYHDLVRWTHSFSDAAAFVSRRVAVGDRENARVRRIVGASASYFDFFDAPPALGRYFSAREDSVPAGAPIAVLGYRFWQSELGGRRDVLGETIRVGRTRCTVIGVAAPGFRGVEEESDPELYIPLSTFGMDERGPSYVDNYGYVWLGAIVRRKPGVTRAAASADLTTAFARSWRVQAARDGEPLSALTHLKAIDGPVQFERGPLAGPTSKLVTWAGGVTFIVLLIACANVANLLLARALVRRREIALRRALGVTGARLLRQLMTESLVLATAGGVVGLAFAQWGGVLLRSIFLPPDVVTSVFGDGRTLAVALVATLFVALATGVVPAVHAMRAELSRALTGAGRDTGLHAAPGRSALLVIQAALSVVLLVGAGLFVRSLRNVRALRLGYDVDPVLVVTDNLRGVPLDSVGRIALENRLVETARTVPGVVAASVVSSVPFWGFEGRALFVPGVDSVDVLGNFDLQAVGSDYFAAAGTRLLRGRDFDRRDNARSTAVMIVSQGMARALWPGLEPLGKCVHVAARDAPCAIVVGVSEDLRLRTFTNAREYMYYLPIAQFAMPTGMLFVRTTGDATRSADGVRQALQRAMPGAAYVTVQPFRELIDPTMQSWRVGATVFVAFGVLALVLAGVGLYSVIAYGVAQRRREIGVRVVLGATPRSVVALVMRGGVRLVAVGTLLGTAIAALTAPRIADLLFQEQPTDPLIYCGVASVVMVVAVVATALPALAAARVDPSLTIRMD
jgi:predicted permease